jgi:N-acetylmuramoyl-L-alanine amidase
MLANYAEWLTQFVLRAPPGFPNSALCAIIGRMATFDRCRFFTGLRAALAVGWWLACGSAVAADVALDVGHTLDEPGALSASGVTEFSFNLQLVRAVDARLAAAGVSTHLINADGRIATLGARTAAAAQDRLFVSVHHDSVKARYRPVTDPQFRGFSLWVSGHTADHAGSVRCARRIGERMLTEGFRPSHYHADPVFGENRPVVDRERGIFENSQLAVLRSARGPAVLFEAGVIAHPDEEVALADATVRERIARALAAGVADCLAADR